MYWKDGTATLQLVFLFLDLRIILFLNLWGEDIYFIGIDWLWVFDGFKDGMDEIIGRFIVFDFTGVGFCLDL